MRPNAKRSFFMPVHLTGSTHDVAWTMTRVSVETYASNANLRLGLTILFLFAVLSGAWLWHLRHRWSNQVGQLEQAIAAFPLEQLPHIRETGERESSDENDIAAIYPNISLYYYWDKYGTGVMRGDPGSQSPDTTRLRQLLFACSDASVQIYSFYSPS
jgi:hypothetical protein